MPTTVHDSPFPLKRRFWQQIAPGLGVLLILMVAATVYVTTDITETIYLSLAHKRAEAIATAVSHSAPEAWDHLLIHGDTHEDHEKLRAAMEQEARELKIEAMKVYDLSGRVLFSTDQADGMTREMNPVLRRAVLDGKAGLQRIVEGGESLYEMYVPYRDAKGDMVAVFELYEPVKFLDTMLWKSGLIAAVVPGLGIAVLLSGLALLVARAQANIDNRSRA